MTLVAGLDVGNATTELVVVDSSGHPMAWDRSPTRGGKGSAESLAAAAALVRRVAGRLSGPLDALHAAPLQPVRTGTVTLPEPAEDTGPLTVAAAGVPTAGGLGFGVGRPVPLAALGLDVAGPVVALVGSGTPFGVAARLLTDRLSAGVDVVAVVLADDEAVLVANRLPATLPVVDGVDADALAAARLVAVEVADPGRPVRRLSDALALTADLGLTSADSAAVNAVCARLRDASNGVVSVGSAAPAPAESAPTAWVEMRDGVLLPLPEAHPRLRSLPPGAARAFRVPGPQPSPVPVDDLLTLDLGQVADAAVARAGTVASRTFALSALAESGGRVDPSSVLAEMLALPVRTVGPEAAAARRGALTTPGADPATAVLDLGGGTIDLVTEDRTVVAAGAGDLLTAGVAAVLGLPRGAAEWVKRGACRRLDTPHLLVGEDGSRVFLDHPARGDAVGALVFDGPAGLLPFARGMAATEWRALRMHLKREVVGIGLARVLLGLGPAPSRLVVVGGPAGDDEILAVLASVLPDAALGRGDVAGRLGPRYAVAYGLAVTPPA